MKNIKTLGIIAMVAIITFIGFAMIACGGGGGPSGDPDKIDLKDSILITFNSNDGSFKTATQTAKKGEQVTLNETHGSGRTMSIQAGLPVRTQALQVGLTNKPLPQDKPI